MVWSASLILCHFYGNDFCFFCEPGTHFHIMRYSSAGYALCFVFVLILLPGLLQAQDLGDIKGQKPFTLHGNLNANVIGYSANGIESRQPPFSYVISANVNASFYGVDLPFAFTYSNRQNDFSQPFNRFGLSPRYKWLTVHAGYRSVNFSSFTMAGHSFLGAGVEMNPGKFRFGFIAGRFNRSTDANTYERVDTLPYYKRNGLAVKIGVGSNKSFVDLIFLKVQDDRKSIPYDTIYPERTPEDNLVTGINSKLALGKKLFFEGEAAVSIYTDNQYAGELSGTDAPKLKKVEDIILINQSSRFYTAARASLIYKQKRFSLKAEYKRIDPNYRSLGTYYFSSDVQSLAVGPAFSLLKRKLNLRGNIGIQSDNLRNTKRNTSMRTVGSANISYNPSQKFGIDGSFSNFSTSQKAGRIPLVDTIKIYQSTSNIAISPRFTIMKPGISHMVMLMLNHTNLNDKNPLTEGITENKVNTVNLNYAVSLLKSKITITSGLNYMDLANYVGSNKAMGITAGIMYMVAKDKLMLGLTNSVMKTQYIGNNGKVIVSGFTATYNLKKHHSFRFNTYFTGNYYAEGASVPSYKEIKGDLSYGYTF